jgi:hypothetical protein
MFDFETLWDLYEFKLFLLLITSVIAIWLGNIFYDAKQKDKKIRTDTENDA